MSGQSRKSHHPLRRIKVNEVNFLCHPSTFTYDVNDLIIIPTLHFPVLVNICTLNAEQVKQAVIYR